MTASPEVLLANALADVLHQHGHRLFAEIIRAAAPMGNSQAAEAIRFMEAEGWRWEDNGWRRDPAEPAPLEAVLAAVREEVERATAKFPTWPTDPLHASGVVQEEAGELAKAVLQAVYEPHMATPKDATAEARQTAAMAVRFLLSTDRYVWAPGVQHLQD